MRFPPRLSGIPATVAAITTASSWVAAEGGEAKVWLDELKIFQNDLFLSSGIWLIPAREALD